MKALEKDRARRYATATELAADVGRHLAGEAVVAAPPSAVYRIKKFARKHRGPVTATTAVVLLGATGLAGTIWEWRRAELNAKVAVGNARAANEQRAQAISQRDIAELEAYIANIALGKAAMEADNWPEARRRLALCASERRGWEWSFLNEQAESVVSSVPCNVATWPIISPNGKLVLIQLGATFRVFDITGNAVGPTCLGNGRAFSLDSRLVVSSRGTQAQIWSVSGGKVGPTLDHHKEIADALFTPDGSRVLTADEDEFRLWDTSGDPKGGAMAGRFVGVSADGRRLLTCSEGVFRRWNTDGRQVGPDISGGHAVMSPDGALVLSWSSSTTQLWGAAGELIGLPVVRPAAIRDVTFSPDSQTVLLSSGHASVLCDPDGRTKGKPINCDRGSFSADGKHMLTNVGHLFQLRDQLGAPIGPEIDAWKVEFTPGGQRVVANSVNRAELWDLAGRRVGPPMFVKTAGFGDGFAISNGVVVQGSIQAYGSCMWDIDGRPSGAMSRPGVLGFLVTQGPGVPPLCTANESDYAFDSRDDWKVTFAMQDRFGQPVELISFPLTSKPRSKLCSDLRLTRKALRKPVVVSGAPTLEPSPSQTKPGAS